ncbi:MAG: response regulator [Candidatus Omnitrophica bacterium]|nr:response regulator [Candidatus Omnitrophota bacterium]
MCAIITIFGCIKLFRKKVDDEMDGNELRLRERVTDAKKILIIDDQKEIGEDLSEFLIAAGYETQYAINAKQGFTLLEKLQLHLLILDLKMAETNGFEVLRNLAGQYPSLIIFVLSGMKEPETIKTAIAYGACEFIAKPINARVLLGNYIRPTLGM